MAEMPNKPGIDCEGHVARDGRVKGELPPRRVRQGA
jgi:hypothetical protein